VDGRWVDADLAARQLGVKPATLYAYVSRGQLRRRPGADGRRSEYHAGDLAELAVRGRRARPVRPSDIVVPSAVTRIAAEGPVYRGRPAVELAGHVPFEQVATLLWDAADGPSLGVAPGDAVRSWPAPPDHLEVARAVTAALGTGAEPAARLAPVVASLRTVDPLGQDVEPAVVVATARSLIATLASTCGARAVTTGSIAARVTRAITGDASGADASGADATGGDASGADATGPAASAAASLVDAALVLLADHELAASTLAVRVAASARCDPYAALLAGLAVLTGRRHGGAALGLERALREVAGGADAAGALARTRTAGGAIAGFGHPLYPDGDPRATRLLALLRGGPLVERCEPLDAILSAAARRGLPPPSVDAVLAGVTHAVGAAPGSAELLFGLGRTAGWIAHALEQYAEPRLLRPRAVYVGV
jgi:citrate synthase